MRELDMDRLRKDLEDYYGTAMYNGLPMAMIDLSEVEDLSEEELEELAEEEGFDLSDYEI